jgi:hypothetical protein
MRPAAGKAQPQNFVLIKRTVRQPTVATWNNIARKRSYAALIGVSRAMHSTQPTRRSLTRWPRRRWTLRWRSWRARSEAASCAASRSATARSPGSLASLPRLARSSQRQQPRLGEARDLYQHTIVGSDADCYRHGQDRPRNREITDLATKDVNATSRKHAF